VGGYFCDIRKCRGRFAKWPVTGAADRYEIGLTCGWERSASLIADPAVGDVCTRGSSGGRKSGSSTSDPRAHIAHAREQWRARPWTSVVDLIHGFTVHQLHKGEGLRDLGHRFHDLWLRTHARGRQRRTGSSRRRRVRRVKTKKAQRRTSPATRSFGGQHWPAAGNLWWRRLREMEGCGAQADAEKEAHRARARSIYRREGGEASGGRGGDCQ
jgi:hypothetical protein